MSQETAITTIKISVVVPVYNPGPHIDGLIASLRRQSLPAEEFEVVFVDDGSTDGTGERLDHIAAESPNMRVIHIPNSGWPGRPRNVGIEAARGEYVQFVDNDDEIGDEALERLFNYAHENDSDVVVGKEIRRNARPILGPIFRENRPRATLDGDPLLILLTPHKLFRRSFLNEHAVRFHEGPRRLEDHPFVMKAYFRAKTISVLSDYTCYYWVSREDRSNAGLAPQEWFSYYGYMRDALDVVEEHTDPGERRDRFLAHWYRSKGLEFLGARLPRRSPEDASQLLEALYALAQERFPPGVDAHLRGIMRVRSALLRAREFERIHALAEVEQGIHLQQTLEPLAAAGSELVMRPTASLVYADGSPVVLHPVDDRLVWRPPIDLGPHVPSEALDFTVEYRSTRLQVVTRGRSSNEAFLLPDEAEILPPLPDGTRPLGGASTARLMPGNVMAGQPMTVEAWDIELQLMSCGWTVRERMRSHPDAVPRVPAGPALLQPRLVLPVTTKPGHVALDVEQHLMHVVQAAPPDTSAARVRPSRRGVIVTIPLAGLTAEGQREIGRLRLIPADGGRAANRPVRLVGADAEGPTRLVAEVTLHGPETPDGLGRGSWRLSFVTPGRKTPLGLQLVVDGHGGVVLRTRDGQQISRATTSRVRRLLRPIRRLASGSPSG